MEIKEKELFEYIYCPLRYQLLSNGNTFNEKKSFKKLCYEAINSYYNSKTNGLKADSNTLKRKWDSIASNNTEVLSPKKVLDGWGLLYRAYEYVNLHGIEFTAVNHSYSIEIPETGVCLTGVLDPFIIRDSYVEIFITCFEKQMPERIDINTKLKHTIDAYVIKKLYNKDVVINYYVPAQGKTIQSLRSTNDFNKLESIIKNVGKAINNNIIYPRETFMCSSCVAREICRAWTGQE